MTGWIRFHNQYLDPETGLYKMGLRYYDPAAMRWTQRDPLNLLTDPRQANRYSFASGDPVNQMDPNGMFSIDLFPDPDCPVLDILGTCEGASFAEDYTAMAAVEQEVSQFGSGCLGGAYIGFRATVGSPLAAPYSIGGGCAVFGGLSAEAQE